jgi:hypothetical protein
MKQLRDGFDTTKLGGSPARHLEMAYRHHLFLDLDPSSSTLLGRTHTQAIKENEEVLVYCLVTKIFQIFVTLNL